MNDNFLKPGNLSDIHQHSTALCTKDGAVICLFEGLYERVETTDVQGPLW